MDFLTSKRSMDITSISKNWVLFLVWGIALIILGLLAISISTLTTLVSVFFLGVLIFIGGIFIFIDAFKSWRDSWGSFFLHIVMAILYLIAGAMLMINPTSAAISLTFILGVFYIVLGAFRLGSSFNFDLPHWGWRFFNGIIALLLGILILVHWPASSLFIIGLFIGIDLVFTGLTYAMLAVSARTFVGRTS